MDGRISGLECSVASTSGQLYTGATFLRASELTLNGVHTEFALYAVDLASGDQSVTSPHLIPEGYHGDIYALARLMEPSSSSTRTTSRPAGDCPSYTMRSASWARRASWT
jgi:hypothetical protein